MAEICLNINGFPRLSRPEPKLLHPGAPIPDRRRLEQVRQIKALGDTFYLERAAQPAPLNPALCASHHLADAAEPCLRISRDSRRFADGIHASGPSAPPEDEGGDQDAGHGEPDAEDPEGRRALLGGAGEDVEVLSEKSRQE